MNDGFDDLVARLGRSEHHPSLAERCQSALELAQGAVRDAGPAWSITPEETARLLKFESENMPVPRAWLALQASAAEWGLGKPPNLLSAEDYAHLRGWLDETAEWAQPAQLPIAREPTPERPKLRLVEGGLVRFAFAAALAVVAWFLVAPRLVGPGQTVVVREPGPPGPPGPPDQRVVSELELRLEQAADELARIRAEGRPTPEPRPPRVAGRAPMVLPSARDLASQLAALPLTFRSEGEADGTPAYESVLPGRVRLRWDPATVPAVIDLVLRDESLNLVWSSTGVEGSAGGAEPGVELTPGRRYLWSWSEPDADGRVSSPMPFLVLDGRAARAWREFRGDVPTRVRAAIDAGLYSEAEFLLPGVSEPERSWLARRLRLDRETTRDEALAGKT